MKSTVASQVFHCIQQISASNAIRTITPGVVADLLHLDSQAVFEAMVKLADVGLLDQQLYVVCPFCSRVLDVPSTAWDRSATCEQCGQTFAVTDKAISVSFSMSFDDTLKSALTNDRSERPFAADLRFHRSTNTTGG